MDSQIDGIKQRPSFSIHEDMRGIDDLDHFSSGIPLNFYDVRELFHELENGTVDQRSERFHEIGSEGEMIVLAVMMDPDIRIERGGAEISGKSGIEDGICVIEKLIGILRLAFPCGEKTQSGPVTSGGARLDVVRVTASDTREKRIEP